MKRRLGELTTVALLAALFVLAPIMSASAFAQAARAEILNAKGKAIGSATLVDDSDGVRIVLRLSDLPPGTHAFHIHAAGRCDPPDFSSAGGHFNPAGRRHGLKNPGGPHLGDLPNIVIGTDGSAHVDIVAHSLTLGSDVDSYSLFPPAGTALVIHERADDEITDPAGNAGARIACGVITR
jgi:superoxide dismutase, Cu-Zn family